MPGRIASGLSLFIVAVTGLVTFICSWWQCCSSAAWQWQFAVVVVVGVCRLGWFECCWCGRLIVVSILDQDGVLVFFLKGEDTIGFQNVVLKPHHSKAHLCGWLLKCQGFFPTSAPPVGESLRQGYKGI